MQSAKTKKGYSKYIYKTNVIVKKKKTKTTQKIFNDN